MRKLRLDMDSLVVQSFPTTAAGDPAQGTVVGRAAVPDKTYQVGCPTWDCPPTHQYSCNGTCGGDTCYESCHLSCHTCMTACFASCPTCEASCGDTCPACVVPTQPGYVCEATV